MSVSDVMGRVSALNALVLQAWSPMAADGTTSDPSGDAAAFPSTLSSLLGDGSETGGLATLQTILGAQPGGLAGLSTLLQPGASTSGLAGVLDAIRVAAPNSVLAALLAPVGGTTAVPTTAPAGTPGQRMLAIAQAEVGQAEQPPGSNDSPRIEEYRTATVGSYRGAPWCAYFVSWAARQAGLPIGEGGSGEGAVEGIEKWAAQTGRLLPAGTTPQPGDIILFGGRHVGIVESVNPDGSLTTVEGNHASAVSRVQRSPSEATGYVRL
ncbi:MAG: CHAP domain-containing protein [Thermoleophilia bacterium]